MNTPMGFGQSKLLTRAVLLLILSGLVTISFWSCESKKPTQATGNPTDTVPPIEPPAFHVDSVHTLYVQAGATGDGHFRNPLGTIQAAVDSAAKDPVITRVLVAGGVYVGSLRINHPIVLEGGRDPDRAWGYAPTNPTVVEGTSLLDQAIGMLIDSVVGRVSLGRLSVRGGVPSMGNPSIALYIRSSLNVQITDCDIVGLNGSDGADGYVGRGGVSGASREYLFVTDSGRGGNGGWGGACPDGMPLDGEQGFGPDGSQTGGLGGTATHMDGYDGNPGTDGSEGENGSDGIFPTDADGLLLPFARNGGDGSDGTIGFGGGGGRGTPSAYFMDNSGDYCIHGEFGGFGGYGGGGGTGGTGGQSGGSSIAVCAVSSKVALQGVSSVITAAGGAGGSGGAGGMGGAGDEGMFTDWWAFDPGDPGRGGDGGNGGRGGGGAGGWSVGLLLIEDKGTTISASTTYQIGQPGTGGMGATRAANGQRHEIYRLR